MPDIILIIFFTFIPLSLHQVRKDIGHQAIALPFLHLVITVNPLLSPLSQITALFNNPGPSSQPNYSSLINDRLYKSIMTAKLHLD